MNFDELPENWTAPPLDAAPLASGVIDLILLDASGQSLLAFGVADPSTVKLMGGRAAANG